MAGRKRATSGVNRSEFIRKVLEDNPDATAKDVIEAWNATGATEELSQTLYYQARRKLGLAKSRGGRKRKKKLRAEKSEKGMRGRSTPKVLEAGNGASAEYLAIEQQIDRLVSQAEALGDAQLAGDLRHARRRASSKLL